MHRFFRQLPSLSYQSQFLWKVALVTITLGIAVGMVMHHFEQREDTADLLALVTGDEPLPDEDMPLETLAQDPDDDPFESQLTEWAFASQLRMTATLLGEVRQSEFTDLQKEIAARMLTSLQTGEPDTELLLMANEAPPPRYANLALAGYWTASNDYLKGARYFEREGAAHDSEYARELAVSIYRGHDAFADLARLIDEPSYDAIFSDSSHYTRYRIAVYQGDWPGIIKYTLLNQFTQFQWQLLLMAVLTGVAWFAFLIHAGRFWRAPRVLGLCSAALVLGVFSTTATLLMITLQHEFWGFGEQEDLVGGLLYCIGGIGLREEFLKLLFFAPLLPFLLKRKDPLVALIVAGCVGLGFAAEENVSYFHSSMGFSGPGRFLTANFLHISTTALTGYALYRAAASRWRELDYFASMFGMIVFAHGLYDAFIIIPELQDYSIFAMTIYCLLCYQMFQVLNQVRPTKRQKISLSFVFTLALSVVLSVCLGYATSMLGFDGLRSMAGSILGVILIVILFFRSINEPIAT